MDKFMDQTVGFKSSDDDVPRRLNLKVPIIAGVCAVLVLAALAIAYAKRRKNKKAQPQDRPIFTFDRSASASGL